MHRRGVEAVAASIGSGCRSIQGCLRPSELDWSELDLAVGVHIYMLTIHPGGHEQHFSKDMALTHSRSADT